MDSNRDESATNRSHEIAVERARALLYAMHSGRGLSHPGVGQHASSLADVCESPLANKTTSCPSPTSSSANHEITRSVPPYSLGGMASVKGAICAICMHSPFCEFDWALQA